MKSITWVGLGLWGALLGATTVTAAKEDPCKVQIGHARPAGCAPFSPKAVKARVKRAKQNAEPRDPESAFVHAIRAPKYQSSRRRSERLLIQELTATERLLRRTPNGSPDRARIIRRLAEGYAELERLAQVRKLRAEIEALRAQRAETKSKH